MSNKPSSNAGAYVVTGPTSGIGLCAALALSRHGAVILVGRDGAKLDGVRDRIEARGGRALTVVCDLSEPANVQRAVTEIVALGLPITGLLNNAGIMPSKAGRNGVGWDLTFATNYLGPFALTQGLIPHLPDKAEIVFVASAIEDPERKPAKVMGMRGGRFLSVEASARGEWLPGGAKMPGVDAYATSKQCSLAATLALARENPRLRINAVEPGINPSTGLGDMNGVLRFVGRIVMRLPPFGRYLSTPERAAKVLTTVLTDHSGRTGIYYDEKGAPMTGSILAEDPEFQDRVVAETRAFLARNIG
ncbi:MAG: SDR family NAD(P)-dependent oxidoreductase [Caulobacteraceae bacterium]|nr:SDR family NAD(P)-dependent oxidoreductase [Caulobacteraceae bacterium]